MGFKGAIIGFGFIAREGHLPAWLAREDAKIVAVADASAERLALAKEALGDCRTYTWASELFACEELDFIDICTPPASHRDLILEALGRGLSVLSEKPLVLDASDMAAIDARRGAHSVYTVHNWKYAPMLRKTAELVSAGRLGPVLEVDYQVLRRQPSVTVAQGPGEVNWRLDPKQAGGGILVDHGWHAFYNIAAWVGKQPLKVDARLENRKYKDLPLEDTATVEIDFGGARARVFFTWAAEERKNTLTIVGGEGKLEIRGNILTLTSGAGQEEFVFPESLSEGSHHPEWFPPVIDGFLGSIKDPAQSNLDEARLCLDLLDAAKRSHLEGRAQPVGQAEGA